VKKIALISYGIVYLLLIAFSVYGSILVGQFSVANLISTLLSMVYLLGFFGYALQKAIWSAAVWRRLFYLISIATLIQLVAAFWAEWTQSIEVMLATLLSLPVIYALYHYGKADSAIWLNDKDHIKAALLETLLGYESMLVVEKAHGVDNTKVTVSKEADSYSVNISRTNNGKEESFANTFNNPGALAVFIEKYTLVTVADFEAKYAR
jgi:prepilin signal peptidase PulO-like enzyme (type II secretory pathway)